MDFASLKQEFQNRGFHYLSDLRQGYFINRSYTELCAEEDWPFLEASTTGTAPITISDLRTVSRVIDSTNKYKLRPMDVRNITDDDTDLTTTGTPTYYYITAGTTVNVYPANTTDTISVSYWKTPTDLSDDSDTPLVPATWHQVIVDGAVAYAYFDSDNFEAATQTMQLWEVGKARMMDALLSQQHDETDDFIVAYASGYDQGWW